MVPRKRFYSMQVNGTIQATEFKGKKNQNTNTSHIKHIWLRSTPAVLGEDSASAENDVKGCCVVSRSLQKEGKLVLLLSFQKKNTTGIFIFLSPSCSNLRKTVISLMLILVLRSVIDIVKGLQY